MDHLACQRSCVIGDIITVSVTIAGTIYPTYTGNQQDFTVVAMGELDKSHNLAGSYPLVQWRYGITHLIKANIIKITKIKRK